MSLRYTPFVAGMLLVFHGVLAAAAEPAPSPPVAPPEPQPPVESRVILPKLVERVGPIRHMGVKDYRVELDLSKQILNVSTPKEETWRTPDEKVRRGDTVAVKGKGVKIRSGKESIADLADGQLVAITDVKGEWVAAAVVADGQRRSGWLKASEVRFQSDEPMLFATLSRGRGDCVSASLLSAKAKQFDDGLYAAIELAAQQGAGKFGGKAKLLAALAAALGKYEKPTEGTAVATVLAAGRLGGDKTEFSKPVEAAVAISLRTFRGEELRSKPIGFYTWSDDLKRIFQQDRMLQTKLTGQAQIAAIAQALHADPKSRETYEGYLKLVSGLTNPLTKPDLHPVLAGLDEGTAPSAADKVFFFPPSRAHETDLIMRLFANRTIPDGFNLADELIKRIQAGDIDLTPRPDSGWYDYQTWSLEPLAIPERLPEAAHLKFDKTYKKQLRELFKGVLALARETHIKQLDIPAPAAEAPGGEPEPRPMLYVSPDLAVEPLPSVYLRRAAAYRYVRGVLEGTFGPEALAEMHRQTASGPVKESLAEELTQLEGLMHGAYVTSMLQIGMTPDDKAAAGSGEGHPADAARFLKWAANIDLDADLGRDVRMMVPVFYDQQRKQTKVWAFLGWTEKYVNFNYAQQPSVKVLDKDGKPVAPNTGPEVHFYGTGKSLAYPVVAEIYATRILDRDEFRRHCDTYQTKTAILKNLK